MPVRSPQPERSLPLLAFVVVFVVVGANARLLLGGMTWSDARYHTEVVPPRLAAADAVRSGSLPAWWEGAALGVPLAGEPSHGAMYPPAWLAATPRAVDWLAIAHLAWAALGVAVWARRRANIASEHAALVAGLLVATSGMLMSAAVRGALPAIAHLPWIGVASAWLGEAEDRRDRARAAVALGALLGLIGLAGVFGSLIDAIVLAIALAARRRTTGHLVAALAGGLAIASAQWLPVVCYLASSHAGDHTTGLPLARLLELIVPASFGSGEPGRSITAIAGDAPWAPSLFVGGPLLAFAAVRTPTRRIGVVIGTFAVLALVVGRGGWPHWLGAPELHLMALVVVLGAHAGAGIDALLARTRRAAIALGIATACTGVALAALAVLRGRNPDLAPAIDRAVLDGVLAMACSASALVLALGWGNLMRETAARPIILALLVLPSVGSSPSLVQVIDREIVDDPPTWATAASPAISASLAPVRAYRPEYMLERKTGDVAVGARGTTVTIPGSPSRAPVLLESERTDSAIATLAGTSAWKWGIAAARTTDPARLADHDAIWLAAAREGGALLDRFGIALAIVPETIVAPRKLNQLSRRGAWSLVALEVAPAAAVMRGWAWAVAPEDALALLYPAGGGTGVLRGSTVLRGGGSSRLDRGPPVACSIERWSAGTIAVACTSDSDGYAVVSSSTAPGWSVTVDDLEADWLTADVMRRAVKVPEGSHRVVWQFAAPGLGLGLAIAGIGLALLVALGLASRR